jgi:NAD dependent epimerase/dehydratase family
VPVHGAAAAGRARGPAPRVNVLVTGGAGFIGSHVVDVLIAAGNWCAGSRSARGRRRSPARRELTPVGSISRRAGEIARGKCLDRAPGRRYGGLVRFDRQRSGEGGEVQMMVTVRRAVRARSSTYPLAPALPDLS